MLKKIFLLFLFVGITQFSVSATHIVGGEMTYRCLGNNQYEITLYVYRDCFNGVPPFDNPAYINVFSNSVLLRVEPFRRLAVNDTLRENIQERCFVVPGDVCVHTTFYKDTLNLPFNQNGYTLVYQRCCRNNTILNIIDPDSTGASFTVDITPEALRVCNQGSRFKQWPPTFICVNRPINFDHSAIDSDGDSLVYYLCEPFIGATSTDPYPVSALQNPPIPQIIWRTPYSINDVLGGTPLSLNKNTGFLTGTPNVVGQFVVGVCMDEYRNGRLLTRYKRDFQYNIRPCVPTTAAFFIPSIICDDLSILLDNKSLSATRYQWDIFRQNGSLDTTLFTSSPTFRFEGFGTYDVRLIAQPGTICADTFSQRVVLKPSDIRLNFDVQLDGCDSALVTVVDNSTTSQTILNRQWQLTSTGYNQIQNVQAPSFLITNSDIYVLNLTMTTGDGCVKRLNRTFIFDKPNIDVLPNYNICLGDSVLLNRNGDPLLIYSWSPPDFLSETDFYSPLSKPTRDITYNVRITDTATNCVYYRKTNIAIRGSSDPLVITATKDTIFLGASTQLSANSRPRVVYSWFPTNGLSNPLDPNTSASPTETTTYTLTETDEFGCTRISQITIVVVNRICDFPFIFMPNAFTPNGDANNDILYLRASPFDTGNFSIWNRWGEKVFETNDLNIGWDGTYQSSPLPPDVFAYQFRVICPDGKISEGKGNVTLIR
jgi:gliding motility-associated-like protein